MPPHAAAAQMNDASSVREWLTEKHPKQLALLDKFETELRMAGRLSKHPSQSDRLSITLRTVEVLKTMIGSTKWRYPRLNFTFGTDYCLLGLIRAGDGCSGWISIREPNRPLATWLDESYLSSREEGSPQRGDDKSRR